MVPDPVEAPVRRRICALFQEHRRLKTVARLLTEEGLRTRSGSAFTDTSLRRLIQDRTAMGEHPQLGAVEAIISENLWSACNAILEARQGKGAKKVVRRPVHLFAGLVVCECGKGLKVRGRPGVYSCSACMRRVPEADLELVFASQLPSLCGLPDEASEALAVPVHERWSQLEPHEKRQVIEAITHRMVIGRDEVLLEVYDLLRLQSNPQGQRITRCQVAAV